MLSEENRALVERLVGANTYARGDFLWSDIINAALNAARSQAPEAPAPVEGEALFHMECPACEWNCIISKRDTELGLTCPICAGDNGRDVYLRSMPGPFPDTVEGHDARPSPAPVPSADTERRERLRASVLALFKRHKMASDEHLAIIIADALAADPAPGGEVEGWRPIETAPRDGFPVDLWAHGERWPDHFWSVNGAWSTFEWRGNPPVRHAVQVLQSPSFAPTHWMPNPSAPLDLTGQTVLTSAPSLFAGRMPMQPKDR